MVSMTYGDVNSTHMINPKHFMLVLRYYPSPNIL